MSITSPKKGRAAHVALTPAVWAAYEALSSLTPEQLRRGPGAALAVEMGVSKTTVNRHLAELARFDDPKKVPDSAKRRTPLVARKGDRVVVWSFAKGQIHFHHPDAPCTEGCREEPLVTLYRTPQDPLPESPKTPDTDILGRQFRGPDENMPVCAAQNIRAPLPGREAPENRPGPNGAAERSDAVIGAAASDELGPVDPVATRSTSWTDVEIIEDGSHHGLERDYRAENVAVCRPFCPPPRGEGQDHGEERQRRDGDEEGGGRPCGKAAAATTAAKRATAPTTARAAAPRRGKKGESRGRRRRVSKRSTGKRVTAPITAKKKPHQLRTHDGTRHGRHLGVLAPSKKEITVFVFKQKAGRKPWSFRDKMLADIYTAERRLLKPREDFDLHPSFRQKFVNLRHDLDVWGVPEMMWGSFIRWANKYKAKTTGKEDILVLPLKEGWHGLVEAYINDSGWMKYGIRDSECREAIRRQGRNPELFNEADWFVFCNGVRDAFQVTVGQDVLELRTWQIPEDWTGTSVVKAVQRIVSQAQRAANVANGREAALDMEQRRWVRGRKSPYKARTAAEKLADRNPCDVELEEHITKWTADREAEQKTLGESQE